jgi:hypothetical protein
MKRRSLTSAARVLVLQVQQQRCPGIDLDAIRAHLIDIARDSGVVLRRRFTSDVKVGYCNYAFATLDADKLWANISHELFRAGSLARQLRKSSIVVCSGAGEDWTSYLLLFHFDKGEESTSGLRRKLS